MASKVKAGGGEKAVWMPKYGRDFYNDEKVLAMGTDLRGWALKGLYEFLLWKAWDEGSIPDDVKVLAAMCGLPRAAFAKLWPEIAVCWQPHPSKAGRLVQKRQERVRAASGELSRKMRELADKRWADDAARREAAGEHVPTDHGTDAPPHAEPHAGSHAPPHSEDASGAAFEGGMRAAMLTTDKDTGHNHRDSQIARVGSGSVRGGVPEPSPGNDPTGLVAGVAAARRVS